MAYFLDTSAIIKRYVQETGTEWVRALTTPVAGRNLFVARIILPEAVAAITRRERGGHLRHEHASAAIADFRHDFATQYRIVDMSSALLEHAAQLARIHALRGYDAVQLAAAVSVHSLVPGMTLISADADLNAAAIAEALAVEDPNTHP